MLGRNDNFSGPHPGGRGPVPHDRRAGRSFGGHRRGLSPDSEMRSTQAGAAAPASTFAQLSSQSCRQWLLWQIISDPFRSSSPSMNCRSQGMKPFICMAETGASRRS